MRSDYQGRDGGWTHKLADAPPAVAKVAVKPSPPSVPLAGRRVKSDIYTAFLRSLPLREPHYDDLKARRLSDDAIRRGLFRSVPSEDKAREIVSYDLDCDLAGIPGFYLDGGLWRMVKTPSGYFIPVRDREGLIQGLQIRRDHVHHKGDARYIWLSSKKFPHGSSPGAPVHIERPERITETGRAIITEGALKAFIAAEYLDASEGGIIALAGVSTFRESLGQQLKEAWPMLSHISVAFDADWKQKREVRGQLHRLIQVLKSADFDSVEVLEWEQEKGLDDFLINESHEVAEVA